MKYDEFLKYVDKVRWMVFDDWVLNVDTHGSRKAKPFKKRLKAMDKVNDILYYAFHEECKEGSQQMRLLLPQRDKYQAKIDAINKNIQELEELSDE